MLQTLNTRNSPGAGRRDKYVPPDNVQFLPVGELLKGSPREKAAQGQLDLLKPVATSEGLQWGVFVSGDTKLLQKRCIAVIGTRHVSVEGGKRAQRFARELAERDVVVVSGLADGVDTLAMQSAIDSGGRTVGVIGTPLGQAYPAKNCRLQETIYRDHFLVSQFPEASRVFPSNFPTRNKTMALLSDASVVIEAGDSSGTLHQAAECVKLNRWLGIARNVVENKELSWPQRFMTYHRFRILDSTDEFLKAVYEIP